MDSAAISEVAETASQADFSADFRVRRRDGQLGKAAVAHGGDGRVPQVGQGGVSAGAGNRAPAYFELLWDALNGLPEGVVVLPGQGFQAAVDALRGLGGFLGPGRFPGFVLPLLIFLGNGLKPGLHDKVTWKEYLENVMKKRGHEWLPLYRACRELNG